MKTKHLLGGVAVIAALALSAPVWAQPASPGGNAMGVPGPNPGGPGLTPYSGGAPMAAPPTSATPPMHRHAHAHHVASTHQMLHAHGPKSGTDTTAQLNQAELARLGAPPMGAMPPPAPMPSPSGGNSMGMPGPNAGGPGLTPYSGAPPR